MEHSDILKKAEPYFNDEKRETIFATSDGQMFDEMLFARNYAVSNKLGKVIEIKRSDLTAKKETKKSTSKKETK